MLWHLLSDERSRRAVEIAEKFADGLADGRERHAAGHHAYVAYLGLLRVYFEHLQASGEAYEAGDDARSESHAVTAELIGRAKYAAEAAYLATQRDIMLGRGCSNDASLAALLALGVRPEGTFWDTTCSPEAGKLLDLIRELFGNPFRPVSADPCWLAWTGGTVGTLAGNIYTERCFEDLPVLADALEEAGCTHRAILGHCRSGGPHVRGCWVLDFILGKS
jgi:hypothetical protein